MDESRRVGTPVPNNSEEDNDTDILVSQGESMITLEIPEETPENQLIETEAYAALFAIGGYTYDNIINETDEEQCNSAKDQDEEDLDRDEEDADGVNEKDENDDGVM